MTAADLLKHTLVMGDLHLIRESAGDMKAAALAAAKRQDHVGRVVIHKKFTCRADVTTVRTDRDFTLDGEACR